MAIIDYLDVYINGEIAETVEKADVTPSELLKKHSGEGKVVIIKQRTERTIEAIVGGGCVGGRCPVKVTYEKPKEKVTKKKKAAKKTAKKPLKTTK
jgi:hypothetical protein